jgi:STE24 endopeptidase
MNTFTWLFLSLLSTVLLAQLWLAQRHARYVWARRRTVPRPFKRKVPLKAHQKAADYTVARTRFGQIEDLYGAGLLLLWTLGGALDGLDRFWRGFDWSPLTTGAVYLLSILLIMSLLDLPAAVYRTFVIEQRFGFNRSTPGLFAADLTKKMVLLLVLGAPLTVAALWLMHRMGTWWWLYVWLLWMGFSLMMVWVYPALIAPLFNRFKPLRKGNIRKRLQGLLRRTGFKSQGIFVIDSSRRTTHGNAFFTGFGKNKRIVFFDNLLKALRESEVEAVVAHELGHFKLKHVVKRLGLMAGFSLAGLALLGWLIDQTWFFTGLGVALPSPHAALMLFLLVGPVFTFFLNPLLARGSRKHEFEADDFAVRQTNARTLANALVKLYKENASTLTPDPLHSAFYDSHPPALLRIANLQAKT